MVIILLMIIMIHEGGVPKIKHPKWVNVEELSLDHFFTNQIKYVNG